MLASHGCSPACQAGIIAVMEPESELDPAITGRYGSGIAQWTAGRRRRVARECGFTSASGACQVRIVVDELGEFRVRDRLFAITNPELAAELFYSRFEMPGRRCPPARVAHARVLYRELTMRGKR